MKYLKKIETILPDNIKLDLEDICLEIHDIRPSYQYITYCYKFNRSSILIYDIKYRKFQIVDMEEVTERIKYFMRMNKYKCKFSYGNRTSKYYIDKPNIFFDNQWNPVATSILIEFYPI